MKSNYLFVSIYFFNIACDPAESTLKIKPISSATIGQFLPILKFAFIFTALLFVQLSIPFYKKFSFFNVELQVLKSSLLFNQFPFQQT